MTIKSSRNLTDLQDYLNQVKNRPQTRDIPPLNDSLLKRAQNGIRYSAHNNDLLEFIGDRVVNLVSALLIEKDKLSKAHHTSVRQVVCNNDTFGRLSFYLKMHTHAYLCAHDSALIDSWNPLCPISPPKVLADLFEAYAGAVYIQHGWRRLSRWLSALFEPLVRCATGDYWLSARPEQIFGVPAHRAHVFPSPETRTQGKLLDYVVFKRDWLAENGKDAVRALPKGTRFKFEKKGWLCAPDCERLEVAVHLINLWICKIVIKLWPEYHQATAKASHVLSAITGLMISERVMAYLGSSLSLADNLAEASDSDSSEHQKTQPRRYLSPTPARLAVAFKATVGWFYNLEPDRADKWGERWLRPVVLRAHDIVVQEHAYRPLIPASYTRDLQLQARTEARSLVPVSSENEDPLSSLTNRMGSVKLTDAEQRVGLRAASMRAASKDSPSHLAVPLVARSCLDRTRWRPVGRAGLDETFANPNGLKDGGNADDILATIGRGLASLSLNGSVFKTSPSDMEPRSSRTDGETKESSLNPIPTHIGLDCTHSSSSLKKVSSPSPPSISEKENTTAHGTAANALTKITPPTAPAAMRSLIISSPTTTTARSWIGARPAAVPASAASVKSSSATAI